MSPYFEVSTTIPHLPVHRWRTALVPCLLICACAVTPAPRYGAGDQAWQADVVRDLEDRRRAYSGGDEGRLMKVVQGYLGVPYKWGGTTRQGMDCSALARAVIRETYGLELPRTSRQMYVLGSSVSGRSRLRPGDLVFFRIADSGPGISHVGVYVGDGRFAHASASRGGVIDELDQPYFASRFAGGRRIRP